MLTSSQVALWVGEFVLHPKKNQGKVDGSDGKEPTCNVGDCDSIPGSGRSPEEGTGNPLQYFCLEKIPWSEKAARFQSMRSQRVGHD